MLRTALIVCENLCVQAHLLALLNSAFPNLHVALALSISEARTLLTNIRPDFALLGSCDQSSLNFLKTLRASHPLTNVVVTSDSSESSAVIAALIAGAKGYLLRSESPSILISRMHSASRGELTLSAAISDSVFGYFSKTSPRTSRSTSLSGRQCHILQLIAIGWSTPRIAEHLGISVNTTDTHIRRLYLKLSIRGRAEAARMAQEMGLIPDCTDSIIENFRTDSWPTCSGAGL